MSKRTVERTEKREEEREGKLTRHRLRDCGLCIAWRSSRPWWKEASQATGRTCGLLGLREEGGRAGE